MKHAVDEQEQAALAEIIKDSILLAHGPLLAGDLLWKTLGYSTVDGFRQAVHRNTAPIELMQLDNMPKKFAMVSLSCGQEWHAWAEGCFSGTVPQCKKEKCKDPEP